MLTAAVAGALEVRAAGDGGAVLTGSFPYNTETELAPGRREVFAQGSLEARGTVYLLSQHAFAKPLAISGRSLDLRQEPDGLAFEARISPAIAATTHGADALTLIREGVAVGVSPGFVVERGGERVERRAEGLLRTITRAVLHELSIVTRPAYSAAEVEARNWRPPMPERAEMHAAMRWR
ncbi:MAG: HK97 family phage prohead protease [Pseudomonadota bacterium]